MPTKFPRQMKTARRLIVSYGTLCTWTKEGTDNTSTLPPEMRPMTTPVVYTDVPIVFIPATRKEMFSNILGALTGVVQEQDVAYIPGDVDFVPANGDNVVYADGKERYVDSVNNLAPDGFAIAYEVTFR